MRRPDSAELDSSQRLARNLTQILVSKLAADENGVPIGLVRPIFGEISRRAALAGWAEVRYIYWFSYELTQIASVAQLAEQLICNQQVVGSSPSASS